jgi:hypothetical protein
MSDLQPFYNSNIYANTFCQALNQTSSHSGGFNIYLKYQNKIDSFPWIEDIHFGRICCNFSDIGDKYIAISDCAT